MKEVNLGYVSNLRRDSLALFVVYATFNTQREQFLNLVVVAACHKYVCAPRNGQLNREQRYSSSCSSNKDITALVRASIDDGGPELMIQNTNIYKEKIRTSTQSLRQQATPPPLRTKGGLGLESHIYVPLQRIL